jgi:type I restriction enzyme S subunit
MIGSWPMVQLNELIKPISRPESVDPSKIYNILGAHWYAEGLYTKETKPGREIAASYLYRIKKGDFVYNRLFAWKGSFALATSDNDNCYASNEFPCFEIEEKKLNPQYLRYYFTRESAWNEALGLSTGGTPTSRNRLKEQCLLKMKIPLPPLDEQIHIVNQVMKLTRMISEAQNLRRTVIDETEKLVRLELTRFAYKDNKKIKLNEVCLKITDGEHATPPRISSGIPLLNARNVRNGRLDLRITDFIDQPTAEKCWKRCCPSDGDILMICVGAPGRVCKLVKPPKIVLTRDVAMIRPNPQLIMSPFLEYVLKSPEVQNQIQSSIKQTALAHIYLNKIASLEIPLPPISIQQQVVDYYDNLNEKVNELKMIQMETSNILSSLTASVLDKAFKGEL